MISSFFKSKRVIGFLIFCGLCIILLLVAYFRLALEPAAPRKENPPVIERGSIVDRTGFPLAVQTNFYNIGLNTKDIKNKETIFCEQISGPLGLSTEELLTKVNSRKNEFVYLRKKISQTMYDNVKTVANENKYHFISYEKIPGRVYPNYALASQLIGFMGDAGKGLAGIELSQDEILSPKVDENTEAGEQIQGKNIYLTIDANLQYKLEQIAYKAMEETKAESMMLLAADSTSGEILTYISLPAVNLNEYGAASQEAKLDRPAMYAYEPGSVFKIFTLGILHNEHKISPNDKYLCDGAYEKKLPNGERIRIKCLDHHGLITPMEAIKYSCNDVLGQISDKIDEDDFIYRIRQLGFGEKTGLEVSSETPGFVKDTDSKSWSARSKPTIAIGQEISVSALQMVQAATAIANGGVPVKLTVIHKISNRDGSVYYEHKPEYKERVFNTSSAQYVLDCMKSTATTGTGSRANIGGVSIGVKTGTAQMANKEGGGYSETDFISNCIAIFPTENPKIILYIVIEKAKGETYAGRIVAPVIAEAADTIIDYMGMSRTNADSLEHTGIIVIPDSKDIVVGSTLPDFTGKSKKELLNLIENGKNSNINLKIDGSGWVVSQNPPAGTPVTENMLVELYLE
ncbi:MAG: transpeptidase family protein [Treponema sp.]|nr:transpeptidase family protein [Treponema sp.]